MNKYGYFTDGLPKCTKEFVQIWSEFSEKKTICVLSLEIIITGINFEIFGGRL